MPLTNEQKRLIDNATPGLKRVPLSNLVDDATPSRRGIVRQGVHVPNAAGAAPTKAEFDALLTSLRNAGVIASS